MQCTSISLLDSLFLLEYSFSPLSFFLSLYLLLHFFPCSLAFSLSIGSRLSPSVFSLDGVPSFLSTLYIFSFLSIPSISSLLSIVSISSFLSIVSISSFLSIVSISSFLSIPAFFLFSLSLSVYVSLLSLPPPPLSLSLSLSLSLFCSRLSLSFSLSSLHFLTMSTPTSVHLFLTNSFLLQYSSLFDLAQCSIVRYSCNTI